LLVLSTLSDIGFIISDVECVVLMDTEHSIIIRRVLNIAVDRVTINTRTIIIIVINARTIIIIVINARTIIIIINTVKLVCWVSVELVVLTSIIMVLFSFSLQSQTIFNDRIHLLDLIMIIGEIESSSRLDTQHLLD